MGVEIAEGCITHIAGPEIVVSGRWMRQRCSWCGAIICDYDLTMCASSDGSGPYGWPVHTLVDVSGLNPVSFVRNDAEKLPPTFCGHEETN